jgi:cytidylate kinase
MISFVCGQLCSGKTLYSKALAHICNGVHIEVGDVVRSIKNTTDRKLLQDSKYLHEAIVERLWSEVNECGQQDLVISGVRQKEILEAFPESTLLWIECPKAERERRYKNRARQGDSQTFEEADRGDINLGINEVKEYIFNNK